MPPVAAEIGRAAAEAESGVAAAEARLAQAEARHAEAMAWRERRREELKRQRAVTLQGVERLASALALPHPERESRALQRQRHETRAARSNPHPSPLPVARSDRGEALSSSLCDNEVPQAFCRWGRRFPAWDLPKTDRNEAETEMVDKKLQRRLMHLLKARYPNHLNPTENPFRQHLHYDDTLWDMADISRTVSGKVQLAEGNLTLGDKGWDHLHGRKNWIKDNAIQKILALMGAAGRVAFFYS